MDRPKETPKPQSPADGTTNYHDRPTDDGKFGDGAREPTSSRPKPPEPKPAA